MIIKKNKNTQDNTKTSTVNNSMLPVKKIENLNQEVFDIDNFDFLQRDERRRGDRRRGYRRIDERNLVSRAQEEAITIKEQAVKEGYEQGINQANEALATLKNELQEFFQYKDKTVEKLSKDILEISLNVAETIIKQEVSLDHNILKNIVIDIIKNTAKTENRIVLRVSPKDADFLRMSVPDILNTLQIDGKIIVEESENIDSGSVIVETLNGIVDASLKTQLEILRKSFKEI